MVKIISFKALRPEKQLVEKIAALPYDVYTTEEARELTKDNPYSFLHVDKAEIDLDRNVDLYDVSVYEKAKWNLNKMIQEGWLLKDETNRLYIYRLEASGRIQTGIVALTSIDEYINGTIKEHELTREDKENDRITHMKYCKAHTGPILTTYKSNGKIKAILDSWIQKSAAIYNISFDDGTKNMVWAIDDESVIEGIVQEFKSIKNLFIADGHHRSAAAVKVGLEKRNENPNYSGEEQFNHYLSVIFPDDELCIMDYNRVIKDLNGLSADEFIRKISLTFDVSPSGFEVKPEKRHELGMYLEGKWYRLCTKAEFIDENNVLESLDISILQRLIIEPILGIADIRIDKRIDFIGGIKGLSEISRRVDSQEMKIGFSLYPTQMTELMEVAEKGEIMPPKSTWFEPKLRSGLFVHEIE